MPKYIANPVEVDAYVITDITNGVEHAYKGAVLRLLLEDGSVVTATSEMTARMIPNIGDYWVIQSDGYVYLNPKDVFERKYHRA